MKTVALFFGALFAGAIAAPSFLEELEIDLPSNDEQSDDKIVGGNTTTIEEYPYQISLRLLGRHRCGGSVLTETRGLTAAHCHTGALNQLSLYTIKAGSTFRRDQNDPNAQIRTLFRIIIHPAWNRPTIQNDIAVLQWIEPLRFGATVRPIVLPTTNFVVSYGTKGVTSGWGRLREGGSLAKRLQAVATPFVNNTACNLWYRGRVTEDMICAGFSQGGRATCHGDSGGPLVDRSSNKFVQIGVVSWARGCARPNAPSVYARVPHFLKWIRRNL